MGEGQGRAVQARSIVIYLGHGNGWPSPYTYDPDYTTKDGFGLNADHGDGKLSTTTNKYYGEPYVATLDLAPNAIVLLNHLCYASGNTEPGGAAPTLTTPSSASTTTRPASSRPAPGRSSPTATGPGRLPPRPVHDQPVDRASSGATPPNSNGNEFTFASSRTPGMTAYMDPDSPSRAFIARSSCSRR